MKNMLKSYGAAGALLLLLLLAGIFLPSEILKWQDARLLEKTELQEAQQVTLTVPESMTLADKLRLISEGTARTLLLENGKNYSQETVGARVNGELSELRELGILPRAEAGQGEEDYVLEWAEVSFFLDSRDGGRTMMLWNGMLTRDGGVCEFMLDDDTGKLLGIGWQQETGSLLGQGGFTERVEVWAEYLGCVLSELSEPPEHENTETPEFYEEATEAYGYDAALSEEEAKALMEKGNMNEIIFPLVLRDDSGEVLYTLRYGNDGRTFSIFPETIW